MILSFIFCTFATQSMDSEFIFHFYVIIMKYNNNKLRQFPLVALFLYKGDCVLPN